MPGRKTEPKGTRQAAAKPAKRTPAWRRADAGSYRSADERFSIDSEGSGRWFLRDAEQPDDFGQPRTTGPYATLDDAKAAAEDQRQHAPQPSPLTSRLGGRGERRPGRPRAGTPARTGSASKPTAAPKRKTWLNRLGERDRAAARRARVLVRALDDAGIANAEQLVRKDVEGGRPAVTEAALAAALRGAVAAALEPGTLVPAARRRVPGLDADEDDLIAFAAFVASRVVEAMLGEISVGEGHEQRTRELPGWRLTEDSGEARRLVVTPSDVLGRR